MHTPITPALARLAAVVAGALFVVGELLYLATGLTAADPLSAVATAQSVAFLAGAVILPIVLAGLGDALGAHRLAATGVPVALVGTALVAGGMWTDVFAVPGIATGAPELFAAGPDPLAEAGYVLSSAVFAIGWALVGLAAHRAGSVPRAAALLLVAGALLAFFPFPLTLIPFGAAVAWIGVLLGRTPSRAGAATA